MLANRTPQYPDGPLVLTEEEQLTLLDLEIESQEPLYTPETYPYWADWGFWELGPDSDEEVTND